MNCIVRALLLLTVLLQGVVGFGVPGGGHSPCEAIRGKCVNTRSTNPCASGWLIEKIQDTPACLNDPIHSRCCMTDRSAGADALRKKQSQQRRRRSNPYETCGISGRRLEPHVYGGHKVASAEMYPWIVSLRDNSGQHFCGGTLISNWFVVTAAHCPIPDKVVLGKTSISKDESGALVRTVGERIEHPQYTLVTNPTNDDLLVATADLALLRLERPVDFSTVVRPICLSTVDAPANGECKVLGWGRLSLFGQIPDMLQEANVSISDSRHCNRTVFKFEPQSMLCVRGRAAGTCNGDSGGPLMCRDAPSAPWTLAGVTSLGNCFEFSVFTRVARFYNWITLRAGISDADDGSVPVSLRQWTFDGGENCRKFEGSFYCLTTSQYSFRFAEQYCKEAGGHLASHCSPQILFRSLPNLPIHSWIGVKNEEPEADDRNCSRLPVAFEGDGRRCASLQANSQPSRPFELVETSCEELLHAVCKFAEPVQRADPVDTVESDRNDTCKRAVENERQTCEIKLAACKPVNASTSAEEAASRTSRVLIVGGYSSGIPLASVEIFDSRRSPLFREETATSLSSGRVNLGAAAVGNYVYAIGGRDPTGVSARTERLDVANPQSTWQACAPMPNARQWLAVASSSTTIFAIGGESSNTLEAFETRTQMWKSNLRGMSTARAGLVAGVIGDLLYAAGGYNGRALNVVEKYQISTNEWSTVVPMHLNRNRACAAVLDRKFYAMGGSGEAFFSTPHSSAEVYTPSTNTWSRIADMSTRRDGCGAAAVGGLIYVFGGNDGRANLDSMEVYNVTTDSWRTLPSKMEVARDGFGIATILDAQ